MIEEARLEDVGSGVTPVTPGWFTVNVGAAAWIRSEAFGSRCVFESSPRVLAHRPDVDPQRFTQAGFTLVVLNPGQPSGLYHAESSQENFLVLSGTCLLLIEEQERTLHAWDFVHCPPGTRHIFVGAGEEPCVIFMIGVRSGENAIHYPVSQVSLEHNAGVNAETDSPSQAYEGFAPWQLGLPPGWASLPWVHRR